MLLFAGIIADSYEGTMIGLGITETKKLMCLRRKHNTANLKRRQLS